MKSTEYEIPEVTVVNDFSIIYKSQEEREGELYDSIEEIKTSKDQFLRKLRFFKARSHEINQMKSILIEENYPKEIFKEFISTLTTNKISLNERNYSVLLQLSNKYQYPELKEQILKYMSNRPDVKAVIDEVFENENEEDFLKEELIASHLDICLKNEKMLSFPIQKLIRILNSPKRVLKNHHLLFDFIKNFIKLNSNSYENDYFQLILGSLDLSEMSIDEMKELFNSKYFSNSLNCNGTKEQMSKLISQIESQEEQIKSLITQIERQEKNFNKYEEETRKQQQTLLKYESRMKEFEEIMNDKYEKEKQKQQKNYEIQSSIIKKLEEELMNKHKKEQEIQEAKIKELEEFIELKYKKEQERQTEKINKLEKQIKFILFTGQISVTVQSDQTIKGIININDCGDILDKSRSKYILNTNGSEKLGRNLYENGNQIENLNQEVTFIKGPGTYYLHALLTDSFGNEKELVSKSVTTTGAVYKYEFTGRVESVTLKPGKYKLEVWGAEGGKNNEFYNHSGKGGYSYGTLTLSKTTKLYIHVGECPNKMEGGWNGGGSGSINQSHTPAGGGGSTDISLYGEEGSTNWNNANHLYSRIIVAGAGGGSSYDKDYANWYGGFGGGTSGQIAGISWAKETEGTQTRAGKRISCSEGQGFGIGGTSTRYGSSGGGSGWYGGSSPGKSNWGVGGSGGSGYVYNSSTASNYPSGCKLNSSFYLTDSATVAGDKQIPNPQNSSTETGHSGHGFARITPQ